MTYYYNKNGNQFDDDDDDDKKRNNTYYEYKKPPSWIAIIFTFAFFWPVGIYLLIRRLSYEAEKTNAAKPRTNTRPVYTKTSSAKNSPETALLIGGAVSLFIGLMSIDSYMDFSDVMLSAIFSVGGVAAIVRSTFEKKRIQRFKKYLTIIDDKKCVSITEIAAKIPASRRKAIKDLQEMINRDYFKGAYIDAAKDILVYSGSEPKEDFASKQKEPEQKKETANGFSLPECQKYINQIKDVNNRIKHEGLSEQIYRIENITQRIFDYVADKPEKLPMIRSFMQYYLPTTLKILNAYSDFEKQDINGQYIGSGKKDIEETMGKVVKSFENLLDKLYMSDVIDISTDIDALNNMLVTDGFADADDGMTLKV